MDFIDTYSNTLPRYTRYVYLTNEWIKICFCLTQRFLAAKGIEDVHEFLNIEIDRRVKLINVSKSTILIYEPFLRDEIMELERKEFENECDIYFYDYDSENLKKVL